MRLRVPSGAIHTWVPLASEVARALEAPDGRVAVAAVDRDEPRRLERAAEDGHTEELLLGDHPDVRADDLEEYGDVVVRLVVAHHQVRLAGAQVLAARHVERRCARSRRLLRAQPSSRSSQISLVTRPRTASTTVGTADRQRLVDVLERQPSDLPCEPTRLIRRHHDRVRYHTCGSQPPSSGTCGRRSPTLAIGRWPP